MRAPPRRCMRSLDACVYVVSAPTIAIPKVRAHRRQQLRLLLHSMALQGRRQAL